MTQAVQVAQYGSNNVGLSFKNRIINGAMGIWQRGTSFTLTASTFTYTADRWVAYTGNTGTVISQSSSVPAVGTTQYSLKAQRPASNTGTNAHVVQQIIESVNMYDLAGQTVTLSFWAKCGANFSASGNTLNFSVNTGTVADQGNATSIGSWTGFAQPLSTTASLTTTWTKYTVTGTIASTALEMAAYFYWIPTGTAGADDSVYITGVQLEKGSTATSFDYRPYGTELSLCQRYFQIDMAGTSWTHFYPVNYVSATTGYAVKQHIVPLRTTATVVFSAANTFYLDGAGPTSLSAISAPGFSSNLFTRIVITTSGATAGYASMLASAVSGTAQIAYSAEL